MAEYQQRPNSGTLFKNDRKDKPTHPDYRGTGEFDGYEFEISAWIKEGRRGKFMSLAFKPKQERRPAAPKVDRNTADVPLDGPSQDNLDVPF